MINAMSGERGRATESADVAYLRPIVRRLGAAEVHRLVELIANEPGATQDSGP